MPRYKTLYTAKMTKSRKLKRHQKALNIRKKFEERTKKRKKERKTSQNFLREIFAF